MADSLDPSKIAGIAINQIKAQNVNIDPDRKSEAEFWVNKGIQYLKDTYEIDPEFYQVDRAEQTVVQYVKIALQGKQPSVQQAFVAQADQWAQHAQFQKHEDEYDPNRERGRFDMFSS
jgi:hypothetical protein